MRVLSIDGGGIRGLIPAIVLASIEERTGRRVHELFDLIAGTSTGGILACALTRPSPLRAAELAALYEEEGPSIFHRSVVKRLFSVGGLVDERYEDDGLSAALSRYLDDVPLSAALTPIFVTAYDIADRFAFFFRSSRAVADPSYDFSMVACARATAAAPTYFEPVEVTDLAGARTYPLIDGGVYAVNPAMCAYADVVSSGGSVSTLLSLGTGSQIHSYEYSDARWWGQLQWARPALDMVFDGIADTIEFQLGSLLREPGSYLRLQTSLVEARDAMDDASVENLRALRREGERIVRERSSEIDAVCERLVGANS